MATNRLVAKEEIATYARVLFDAVSGDGQDRVVEVFNEFESIKGLLLSDMELARTLSDADFTADQRETLTKAVFSSADPDLASVLGVMAARDDLAFAPRVFGAYAELIDQELGVAIVDVTTVVSLNDELRDQIRAKAEADLGKTVILREFIDPSLMAGIVLSTGGKRIDASVVSQLAHARQVLKERTNGGESS